MNVIVNINFKLYVGNTITTPSDITLNELVLFAVDSPYFERSFFKIISKSVLEEGIVV